MKKENKSKDTIRNYTSALVRGFIEQSQSISSLQHNPTKGQLRELFVTNILKPFLSSQFDVGTGIIINQRGEESNQTFGRWPLPLAGVGPSEVIDIMK